MNKGVKSYGSKVLVPVVGTFAVVSSDVDALADVIASALAVDYIQFLSTSAAEVNGVCKQRTRAA